MDAAPDVTRLLANWRGGDASALEQLTPLVYAELRRLASGFLRRERPGHTLQPTALVHEAYMRLVDQGQPLRNRAHFLAVAAQLMRLILVDHARRKYAEKRGAGANICSLDEEFVIDEGREPALVALDDALTALAAVDPRKARVIELRYFGGLTTAETAEALELSTATVERETRVAHLWVGRHMKGESAS
jgi:RNA polymerase sigma factor (TIGR02999 family)